MNHKNLTLASLIALSGALSAQITVFPSDHTTVEGSSSEASFPFSAGVARYQAIYSNWDIKVPNGASIKKVGVRADAGFASVSHRIQLEITMAQTDNYDAPSSIFANNLQTTPVVVFAKQIVTLPAITQHMGGGPSPTNVLITLDTPFTYDASKHLVVDYKVYSNDNNNQPWSYRIDRASFFSETGVFGTSCNTSGGLTPAHTVGGAALGAFWNIRLASGLANADGALMLGVDNTNWGGTPLPISLGFLGASSCSLWIAPLLTFPARLNSSGALNVNVRMPLDLGLYGLKVYTQIAFADVFAPGSLVTSNGASATMGVAPQMKVLSAQNNADATSGSLVGGSPGYVSVFEH